MTRIVRSRLKLSGATALALFLPSMAFAQDAGSTTQLTEIVVEGGEETATGPVDGYVARKTNTGSKTGTPLKDIPQSVSVVGRRQMDDQGAEKVDEALRYTAGVLAQPFGSDSDTNWLFIRGFQATQTGTYQDGLQNYSEGFGGFFIDSFNLERIEVLRGAASVLYGSSNPGGLVNYVSKRPTGTPQRRVETGINDAGTGYLGFDVEDALSDALDYRIYVRLQGGDGYTDFAEGIRGTISPTFTWQPDDATSFTVIGNYTGIDEHHVGGGFLPYVGTVVDAPFGRIDPDANFTEPDIDLYKRQQASFGYEFEHTFDNDWTVRQNVRAGYADIHEIAVYAYGYNGYSPVPTDPDNLLQRLNFEHKTQVGTFLVDNQLQGKVDTGPLEHTLLFGLDYKYFNIDKLELSGSATLISPTDPIYGLPQGVRTPYIDQDLTQQQIGVYMQDQIRFGDDWLVTLNGRYDYVRTEASDRIGTASFDGSEGEFSGRAGIAYEFANGVTPYASASSFFNPLLGSSPVAGFYKPESGYQYEVGVKYMPTWFDGTFTAAYFDLTKKNVVTGPYLQETQIGEVNSRGFELEAQANVTDNLRLTGAFTTLDLEITEDADPTLIGNSPYIVPEQQASLFLDYTFDDDTFAGLSVGGGVRYVGSSWVDNANTLKVPAVTLADAKIGYKRDNWGVDFNVTNLFDKTYVASCQTQLSCFYGEGRTFKLKAYATW
ncbi:TonB-dependent siderophore receptor [Shinella sp.]|uniref:TonB-dependent siderophore receptor n=1 Tax=Shinella sp. TaxID=1870904 RepID=UPI003F720876